MISFSIIPLYTLRLTLSSTVYHRLTSFTICCTTENTMLNPFDKRKLSFSTPSFSPSQKSEKPTYPIVELYQKLTSNKPKMIRRVTLVPCCFHGIDNHPSLALYSETNTYNCFSCGAHGDIYKMVMELENLSFPEALTYIKSL